MTDILPSCNSLVTPLLTDLYQITMAYGYWKSKRSDEEAVFELFFRKNPFGGQFTVFSGLDEVLKFLTHFRFSPDDLEYLKLVPSLCHCEPEFFNEYLAKIDCSQVTVRSMKQGSIAFPRVPLLIVSGPLGITQLIETTLLNLVNFPSLITTNASRMVSAAQATMVNGKVPKCVEFGLRRAQGPDGGFTASKYSFVGGFDGTSNVAAGKLLNVPISGTHAHSFVQSYTSLDEVKGLTLKIKGTNESVKLLPRVLQYRTVFRAEHTNDSELAAFISYGIAFPDALLCLIDTYDTIESGLINFIMLALALDDFGYVAKGIRLDSGDLGALSLRCDTIFKEYAMKTDRNFFNTLDIVASNDINEKSMQVLNQKGHAITMFGIGTNLVTCQAQPALGCVYKLVQLNGTPRIKLSNDLVKVLIPSSKKAYRLYGKHGWPMRDLLVEVDEDAPKIGSDVMCRHPYKKEIFEVMKPTRVEELHSVAWDKNNGIAIEFPSLVASKKLAEDEKKSFHPSITALKNAKEYEVSVSEKLFNELHRLWIAPENESVSQLPKNGEVIVCPPQQIIVCPQNKTSCKKIMKNTIKKIRRFFPQRFM